MVDGGGWSKKRFSDFSQNFVRCNSVGIKLFLFRKFVTSFFRIGQKSDFVRKKLNFWFNIPIGSRLFFSKGVTNLASLARAVL